MIPANPLLSLNPFHSNPGVDRIQPAFLSQFQADYDGDTVIGNSIRLLNRRKKGPGKGKVKIIQRLITYV
ncbi:hypothetical protein ACFX2L_23860 [Escherichia coli]|uniref:hypothetical protein n=1 Tax=Escherichia coli TaxID=562 RepID=UPI00367CB8F4